MEDNSIIKFLESVHEPKVNVTDKSQTNESMDQLQKIWDGVSQDSQTFDSNSAYAKFLAKTQTNISSKQTTTKIFTLYHKIGAIAAVAIGVAMVGYWSLQSDSTTINANGNRLVSLSDGSKVHLQNGSSLSYEEDNNRSVTLEGNALFEVAKAEGKPFTIQNGDNQITVLGTTFYCQENKAVKVLEGKVSVKSKKIEKSIIVTDDQELILDEANFGIVHGISLDGVDFYNSSMTYENEPLSKVLADIEAKFKVNIKVTAKNNWQKCNLTAGDLSKESLKNALDILKIMFNAEIKIVTEKEIVISKISC